MRQHYRAVLFLCAFVGLYGQTPPTQQLEVKGTVVNSVTGEGIGGALVLLNAFTVAWRRPIDEGGRTPARPGVAPETVNQRVVTESSGRFSFTLQQSMRISLQVSRRGYRYQSSDVANISLAAENVGDVTVKLDPMSVVHGRIITPDGEPLPGVSVQLLQVSFRSGRRTIYQYASKVTDDLGEYRLWSLSPGQYYLKVMGRRGTFNTLTSAARLPQSDDAYRPVYYPASPSQESAQLLRVAPGATIRADFTIEPQPAYRIRGMIKGFASYSRTQVRLVRGDDPVGNRAVVNASNGVFDVYDVTPGTYLVQAYNSFTNPQTMGEEMVTVANRDVSGVVVNLDSGVEVKGTAEYSGTPPQVEGRNPRIRQRYASVQAIPVSDARLPVRAPTGWANLDETGNFTLKLFPGRYQVTAQAFGYFVSSIRSGTADVLADGLTVTAAGAPEIKILLTSGGGRIEGNVTNMEGLERVEVVLIRRLGPGILATATTTDPKGRFVADNLAPGDYEVYAWPGSREVEYYNPSALQALSGNMVRVFVRDGAREQVSLRMAVHEQP